MTGNRASLVSMGDSNSTTSTRRYSHLPPNLDPAPSNHRHRRHTALDLSSQPAKAFSDRSASNLLDGHDEFDRQLYNPILAPHLQRRSGNDGGVSELIDFLRNHSPPPDNFMSIPDQSNNGDERGRGWTSWKNVANVTRRSKSVPRRRPPQIRLPDTAVSGTTTGGHRHIAITIPLDAFPMGDVPRSQYPVYSQGKAPKSIGQIQIPPRTSANNDKGVVTVLRTVSEERETSPSSTSSDRAISSQYRLSKSLPRTPLSPHDRQSVQGYFSAPPSRGSIHGSLKEASVTRQSSVKAFPSRSASVNSRTPRQHKSIDGLLLEKDDASNVSTLTQPPPGSILATQTITVRHDKATRKNLDSKPLPSLPEDVIPKKEVKKRRSAIQGLSATTLKESLLGARPDTQASALTPSSSTKSRRERVRDKRLRDIEAHQTTKKIQEDQKDIKADILVGNTATVAEKPKIVVKDLGKKKASVEKSSPPTFSAIQVIWDVEPTTPVSEEFPPVPKRALNRPPPQTPVRRSITEEQAKNIVPAVVASESTNGGTAESNNPTPPLSPKAGSPTRRHSHADRTSLSRRREWKASRENDRKSRESRFSMNSQGKKSSVDMGGEAQDDIPAVDREILRLYEAYREHRFRDMERRLRRLERNGDVWLRALVPVLDGLNQNVVASRRQDLEQRVLTSENEPAAAATSSSSGKETTTKRQPAPVRRARSAHSQRNPREASLVQKLEEVMENDVDSRRCSSRESDEVSGLDIIEPLMRELAGAAKARQSRSRELRAY